MVPSLTAVDATGTPITPGLLYGDGRGRAGTVVADGPFPVGEAAEFLRWTAAQAPDAAGYWPAPAVANYALAGERGGRLSDRLHRIAVVRRRRLERGSLRGARRDDTTDAAGGGAGRRGGTGGQRGAGRRGHRRGV